MWERSIRTCIPTSACIACSDPNAQLHARKNYAGAIAIVPSFALQLIRYKTSHHTVLVLCMLRDTLDRLSGCIAVAASYQLHRY